MSGFFKPAAEKRSMTPSGAIACEMICRMAWSSSSSVRGAPGARLASVAVLDAPSQLRCDFMVGFLRSAMQISPQELLLFPLRA
jgi:hypothetical protein